MWSTEEHEESVYNLFISEVRNFRMRVEAHEEQLIRQIRSPLERDDSKAIMQRITEQEVLSSHQENKHYHAQSQKTH